MRKTVPIMTSIPDELISKEHRRVDGQARSPIEGALLRLARCTSVTGPGLYREIVVALTEAVGARWALLAELPDGPPTSEPVTIRTIATVADGTIVDDIEYELAGTPCDEVLKHGTCQFTGDLKRRFPDDQILHEMGVKAYLGTPLRASDGSLLGLLAIQHDRPLDESRQPQALLELLAGRAASALEADRRTRALRRNERNLSDFFENAAVGLHWVDRDGIITRANRAELVMMGYDGRKDEYLGRHIVEFHADRPVIEDILARLSRGETLSDYPARLIRRDGTIRHALITSNVLFEDGEFIHTRCFTRDVTEQREAEEALRQQAAELKTLLDTLPVGVFFAHDPDCRRITGNRAGHEILRMPPQGNLSKTAPDEERPRHFRVCRDGVELPPNQLPVQRAARGEHVRNEEVETVFDDGTVTHQLMSAAPLVDANGRPRGSVASILDITERKRAEQALRRSEERYRTLVDVLPAGVYVCAADGTITAYNRRSVELWGREPKVGDSDQRFCGALRLHWPDGRPLPHEKTPMAECLSDGQPKRDLEVVIERTDGSRITVLVNISPLHDERGNIIGAINCFQDITQRKNDERLLAQRLEQLRVLYALTATAGRASGVKEVYEAALDGLQRGLRADRASILLYDEGGVMRFAAWRGLSDGYRAAVEGHSPWKPDDPNPAPVFIEDVETADLGPLREVVVGEGIRALGFFPLHHHGRLIGKFMVYFDRPHTFTEGEEQLAGTIAGHVSSAIERQRAGEQLRQREEEFRALTEHSPDIIARFDRDLRHLYINSALESLTGLKREALLGRTNRELGMPADLCDEWDAAMAQAFETGERRDIEFSFPTAEGVKHFMSRITPEFGPNGEVVSVLGATRDITARKRAEEQRERLIAELRHERSRLTEIFERTTSFMFVFRGPDHVYEFANSAYFELVNRDASIIGKPLREVFPEIEQQGYVELLDRVYSTGERTTGHESPVTIKQDDGERTVFVDFVFEPLRDVEGKITGVLVQGVDQTAQVEARRRIEESEERFRSLTACSPVGVFMNDPAGACIYINPVCAEICGIERAEDAYGDGWAQFVHPEDRERVFSEWAEKREVAGEFRFLHKDGAVRWVHVHSAPLRSDAGGVVGTVGTVEDVTERREAEQRLRQLADVMPQVVWTCAADGSIEYMNDRWYEYSGVERGRLDDQAWIDVLHPDDRERCVQAVMRSNETGEPFEIEIRLRNGRTGDYRWFLARRVPMFDEQGRVQRWFGTSTDIHEYKRAQEAQARLAAIVETSEDAIVSKTLDGIITSWNRGAERIFGYSAKEAVGKSITTIIPPERLDEEVHIRARLASGKRIDPYETERITKDGRRIHVSLTASPVRDEKGRIIGASKIARDITKRKRIEAALRESEARLKLAMDAGRMGAWEWHIDSGRIAWSPVLEQIHGIPQGTFGGTFDDFARDIHDEDRERVFETVRAALAKDDDYGIEYRIVTPTGEVRWLESRGRILRDGQGSAVSMAGICMDVTARKHAEEELARHRDSLEQLVIERTAELDRTHERLRHSERMAALGTLSAGLGHDMGNLLLPMQLRLDAIERKTQGLTAEEGLSEDLDAIRRCAEYMRRLTSGLRLFALDPEDDRASHRSTDLAQWWTEVEPFLKNALPGGVELERSLPESLPRLRFARHLLTQAVFNLVQNAGEAMRESFGLSSDRAAAGMRRGFGTPRVSVSASLAHAKGFVRVVVTDNGPGMSAAVRKRCVEPFFTTKPRGLSTGMGLALVHGIVRRAGGTIDIQSQQGKGTSIAITLPACSPSRHDQSSGEPSKRGRAVVDIADARMRAFTLSVTRSLAYETVEYENDSTLDQADLWLTDDEATVRSQGAEFLGGGAARKIVLVTSPERAEAALAKLPDIVLLDPASGRAGCWRTLRRVIGEMSSRRQSRAPSKTGENFRLASAGDGSRVRDANGFAESHQSRGSCQPEARDKCFGGSDDE